MVRIDIGEKVLIEACQNRGVTVRIPLLSQKLPAKNALYLSVRLCIALLRNHVDAPGKYKDRLPHLFCIAHPYYTIGRRASIL